MFYAPTAHRHHLAADAEGASTSKRRHRLVPHRSPVLAAVAVLAAALSVASPVQVQAGPRFAGYGASVQDGTGHVSASLVGSTSAHAGSLPDTAPPNAGSDAGTTIDPLLARCTYDSPTCGDATGNTPPTAGYPASVGASVGETYGGYNHSIVDLLYSMNFVCDSLDYPSHADNGCEAGAGPGTGVTTPSPANPPSGLTGRVSSAPGVAQANFDTLYVPVPLFKNPPPLQCNGKAVCVDHPGAVDMSALNPTLQKVGYLPPGTPDSALYNAKLPGHNHIVATRNAGFPEWWNVVTVGVTSASAFRAIEAGQSVSAINRQVKAGKAILVPTNIYLWFQVLPGTVPLSTYNAAKAHDFISTSPPGPAPADNGDADIETGATVNNLVDNCRSTEPNCENIGLTPSWIDGQDVSLLYTENFWCDTTVPSSATSGCEAGAAPNKLPPGVTGPPLTAPYYSTTGEPGSNEDPLYIPVPLFAGGVGHPLQCNAGYTCIDHPADIDLSRLASTLGTTPEALAQLRIPGHDHIITTRNANLPEWWNVVLVGVTTPAAFQAIEAGKSFDAVTAQVAAGNALIVPTNAYLWFQTLPGVGPASPGPLSNRCTTHLPSGTVVAMAPYSDGTGYMEVTAAGDVAVFGQASCYGSLTGVHLDKPVVGAAVDKYTGGYWLVSADGQVVGFNAPSYGSLDHARHHNQRVVGMAATPNAGGYWLVTADGQVYPFGNAGSYGSLHHARHHSAPVVGMAADTATGGYWLVTADGRVSGFNAPSYGSLHGARLQARRHNLVVGMSGTITGQGYHLYAADGRVFAFGAARFYGSLASQRLGTPVVGGAADYSTGGYWLVDSNGKTSPFNAPSWGSAS